MSVVLPSKALRILSFDCPIVYNLKKNTAQTLSRRALYCPPRDCSGCDPTRLPLTRPVFTIPRARLDRNAQSQRGRAIRGHAPEVLQGCRGSCHAGDVRDHLRRMHPTPRGELSRPWKMRHWLASYPSSGRFDEWASAVRASGETGWHVGCARPVEILARPPVAWAGGEQTDFAPRDR